MDFVKKNIFLVLIFLCATAARPVFAQNFTETPEHKKMWKKFGRKKHREAFNPSVDSKTNKATHETSRKLAKEDKKVMKQQQKEVKKQKRKLRKQGKLHKAVKK